MDDRIFGEREKAMEEAFFRDQDARLLDKLRQRADLDDIAVELGRKLQVDSPELLAKVRELGVTLETAAAFFLAPLVQVAWAEGKVKKSEHNTVLRLAAERGIAEDSPALAKLKEWLRIRPSDSFFSTALEVLHAGFAVLPPAERESRVKSVLDACRQVAEASAGVGRLFGIDDGVSSVEADILESIAGELRSHD